MRIPPIGLISFLLAVSLSAAAGAATIEVIPAEPTDNDEITLHIHGERPDACWEYIGATYPWVLADTVYIDVYWRDNWLPQYACPTVIVEYDVQFPIGTLSAGDYTVLLVEHNNPALRLPWTLTYTFDFFVEPSVSSPYSSWGRIKGIHRR